MKAFVVQDCYTVNREKKTLEHVAEVLRFLVQPKPEVTGDEAKEDSDKLNISGGANDTSVKVIRNSSFICVVNSLLGKTTIF